MRTRLSGLVCVTIVWLFCVACTDETAPNNPSPEQKVQKLSYWSDGLRPMDATVCFYKIQSSVPDADFDASAAVIRQIIEDQWAAASGLQFQWTGRCSAPIPDPGGSGNDYHVEDIRIGMFTGNPPDPSEIQTETSPNPGVGCTSFFYNGNWGSGPDELESLRPCAYTMVIGMQFADTVYSRRNTSHEFGHSLGFSHEHEHRDNPQTVCPSPTFGAIRGTPYDVMSVMHYNYAGGTDWTDCPAPGNWGWDLSSRTYTYEGGLSFYDRLGAELAYPRSLNPLVCGDPRVIRSGTIRFQADVVRRGAIVDDTSESMLQNVVWRVDGRDMAAVCAVAGCTADAIELRFPANLLRLGAHTVQLDYDDFWGRHHTSTTPFTTALTVGPFESFEISPTSWTADNGTLVVSTARATDGAASLQVIGGGYIAVKSEQMLTSDLAQVGNSILLDVFLPSGQPNPYWLGAVQLFISIPGRNIHHAYLGQVELTGRTQNAWNVLSFTVPAEVRAALETGGLAVQFEIATNTPYGAPPLYLDNVRFSGGLTQQIGALDPCPELDPTPIPQNTLFSFDVPGDWDALNVTDTVGTINHRIALEVNASGYTQIVSRTFSTSTDIPTASNRLLVDLMLPGDPVNPYWLGALSGTVTCPSAGLNNVYFGNVELTNLPPNIFQTIEFALPAEVVSALNGDNSCTIELDLNVGENAGAYYLDNMRFESVIPVV